MASLPEFAEQPASRRTGDNPSRQADFPGHSPAKRDQILGGAREVFLASGFDGASMGEIARQAGVSKGTLYVYFESKEDLFAALVTEECKRTAEACFDLDPDAPAEDTLRELGRRYIEAMLEPSHVSTIRMVIGVAEKLPDIGRAYLQAGPEAGVGRLSEWLKAKMERGELAMEDVELAAWQFILGCHAKLVMPMIFGDASRPDAAVVDRLVDHTVRTFMSAFARRRRQTDPSPQEASQEASAASADNPSRNVG